MTDAADPGAESGPEVQAVIEAELARCRALVAGDAATLDALLADGLVYLHSTGRLDDKASYMAAFRSGRFRYRVARPHIERAVRQGCAIALQGRFELDATVDERHVSSRNPCVCVWVAESGRVRMLSWAAAPAAR